MERINGNSYKSRVYAVILSCFILMTILLIYAVQTMKTDYFNAIGMRAMNFSMVMTDRLNISDAELERLTNLEFNALLEDSVNAEFESYVRQYMPSAEIKYVYVLHQMEAMQIKYSVEAGEEAIYGLPLGVGLNTIYLIDAVISDETRLEDTDYQGYADKDRYTFLPDEIQAIYDERDPAFKFYMDEWGTYISGFAPIYTIEGSYIGMLASDVIIDEYLVLLRRRIIVLVLFCLLVMIMITLIVTNFQKMYKIEETLEGLKERAYLDEMTGFYNRRTFSEQSDDYTRLIKDNAHSISVTMIDIDHFKELNDTYGHPKGDEILKEIASVISRTLGNNEYPFRYGGDELMILSVEKEDDYVYANAENILTQVNALKIEGVDRRTTLSIGIASAKPGRDFDIYDLIKHADEMLYESKNKGRNCVTIL